MGGDATRRAAREAGKAAQQPAEVQQLAEAQQPAEAQPAAARAVTKFRGRVYTTFFITQ